MAHVRGATVLHGITVQAKGGYKHSCTATCALPGGGLPGICEATHMTWDIGTVPGAAWLVGAVALQDSAGNHVTGCIHNIKIFYSAIIYFTRWRCVKKDCLIFYYCVHLRQVWLYA